MASLGKAIEIAARAHADRVYGEDGQPYVLHCLNVMHQVRGEPQRIVAVLHAAIEESNVSFEELQAEGFASEIVEALQVLARRPGESPVECARRVCSNGLARAVKLSDVATHMNEDYAGGSSMDPASSLAYSEVKAILISGGRNAP
jgi:(p)ppGpp synthase/HD superfamily hydrolase